jgi:hypothetical protein
MSWILLEDEAENNGDEVRWFGARYSDYNIRQFLSSCVKEAVAADLFEHGKILNYFSGLPIVLKKKIQEYHVSRRPHLKCPICYHDFYTLFRRATLVPFCSPLRQCFQCRKNAVLKINRPIVKQWETF